MRTRTRAPTLNMWRAPGTKRPASTRSAYNSSLWRKYGDDTLSPRGRTVGDRRGRGRRAAAEGRRAHGHANQPERSAGAAASRSEDRQGLRPAEDGVGRSADRGRVHEQRRERHPVREAGAVRRQEARGRLAGPARRDGETAAGSDGRADAGLERIPRRDQPLALVREL